MRIICPSCDAQYEVPDDVIPGEGREVQCSNCGATWMFGPSVPAGAMRGQGDDERTSPPGEGDDGAENAPAVDMPRRELDPKVASILRAEAARESAARAADTRPESLEVQPDLGLTEGARPHRKRDDGAHAALREAADHPAPGRPGPAQAGNMTVAAATAAGSRRELLPDIEEINSTLRSSDRAAAYDDLDPGTQDRVRRRRGFGLGLLLAVLIFVVCLLVYQFAPEIAEAVPQTDPWLSSYVTWVDEMRTLLDLKLRQLLAWLDAQAAPSGE